VGRALDVLGWIAAALAVVGALYGIFVFLDRQLGGVPWVPFQGWPPRVPRV